MLIAGRCTCSSTSGSWSCGTGIRCQQCNNLQCCRPSHYSWWFTSRTFTKRERTSSSGRECPEESTCGMSPCWNLNNHDLSDFSSFFFLKKHNNVAVVISFINVNLFTSKHPHVFDFLSSSVTQPSLLRLNLQQLESITKRNIMETIYYISLTQRHMFIFINIIITDEFFWYIIL